MQSGNITVSSIGVTDQTLALTGTGVAPLPASQLAVTTITPASPIQNSGFSVTVRSVDISSTPQNVSMDTDFSISLATGSGSLGGTLTGTILSGTNQAIVTGVTYDIPATNVSLTATRTAGMVLTPGTSSVFTVLGVATQLVFTSTPTCPGGSGTDLTTFTVEARRADNSLATNFSSAIVISINSGPGSVTGTISVAASSGIATFSAVAPTSGGTITLLATSGAITGISGSIVVSWNPTLTEDILPLYIQGNSGTNNNRLPYAARLSLTHFTPSTTYRYYNSIILDATDGVSGTGAGTAIFVNGGTFTQASTLGLSTVGTYGTFTTDASGDYTGWFISEPSGNARFLQGNAVRMRLQINDGASGTSVVTRLNTSTISVYNLGSAGANASGVRGTSLATPKNFIFTYNNTAGTGRPATGTYVESDGVTPIGSYANFYRTIVDGVTGSWGTFVPNSSATGIRRIEQRDLTTGAIVGCAPTDADGTWPSGTITAGASSGTTALVIATGDAPMVTPTFTSASISGTYTCEGSKATINLVGLYAGASHTIGYTIGSNTFSATTVVADGSGNAAFLTGNLAMTDDAQVLTITTVQIGSSTCSISPSSSAGTLEVRPRPTVDISAKDFICLGQLATVNFFFTGTGPWNMSYTDNAAPITPGPIGVSPYTFTTLPATVSKTYVVTNLSDANCTATAPDLDNQFIDLPIPCSITWTGATGTDWTTPGNWSNLAAPSNATSVVIPGSAINQPSLTSATGNCANFKSSGSTISLGFGGILNIRGDLTIGGYADITGVGETVLLGTGLQTLIGTLKVSNLKLSNNSAQGVVIDPTGKLIVNPTAASGSGLVTIPGNAKLTTNGNFILGSNAIATAKIGPIPVGATIIGDVTMERYLPHGAGSGSWYFLGTPTSGANYTDYVDDFKVTGLSTGFGLQGGSIISSPEPERSTIFGYDQTMHNVVSDTVQKIGWRIPGNVSLNPGVGHRIFVNYYSNSTHKLDNKGTITRNDFNWSGATALSRNEYATCPLGLTPSWSTSPCGESNRGWNLIANPYPCDINWNSVNWVKPAQMNNAFFIWAGTGYRAFLGSTGSPVSYGVTASTNTNPGLIPSSQAFFVKLSTPGTYTADLKVTENAKDITNNGQFVRTAVASEQVRLRLSSLTNMEYGYDAGIRFDEAATNGFDMHKDLDAFEGSGFEFNIVGENGREFLLNSIPVPTEMKMIPMVMKYHGNTGAFRFAFMDAQTLPANVNVYLKDNFLGTLTDMGTADHYDFEATSGNGSILSNRFEIWISPNSVTANQPLNGGFGMIIYPNPSQAGNSITISMTGFESDKAGLTITDVLGRVVFSTSVALNVNGMTEYNFTEKLSAGIYTVKTTGGNRSLTQKMIVK